MKFTRTLITASLVIITTACSSPTANTSTDATPNEVTLLAYLRYFKELNHQAKGSLRYR